MKLTICNETFHVEVQYAKRKKIKLEATPEGHLTLKVPRHTSEEDIVAFLESKSEFLMNLRQKQKNKKFISNQKSYADEELFLYLGQALPLSQLLEEIPEEKDQIQQALQRFYTKKTKQYVKKRIPHFQTLIGVKAKSITVLDSPRTWGTCNSNRELTFNYKLIMAPPIVIDYVIIHELCHIHHMNHDRSFWRKVGMYDPNYKQHQAYLETFGGVMTI